MTEDLAPLRNAISRELDAQHSMRCGVIDFVDLPEIAYAIAANLVKEFHIGPISRDVPDLADWPDR